MQAATVSTSDDAPAAAEATSADRHAKLMRHAVRNVRLISASYLVDGFVLGLFALSGAVAWGPVLLYTACGLLLGAVWTQVFTRGWSRRFRDPHLPMSLSLCHQVVQLLGMLWMPQLSFVFLLVLFLVFTSLALRVTLRKTVAACVVSCAGAGLVLAGTGTVVRVPDANAAQQWLSWSFVALTLWQCLWIGTYNGAMTALLKRRSAELAELTRRVQHLAQHDELTGLLNRRSLLAILDDELRRADRTGSSVSVALMDLDHFKAINDRFGHPAGDATLKRFATQALDLARKTDRVGRYGGEEFLAVLTATSAEEAPVPVERLRQALRARGWDEVDAGSQVTFSCGLATYQPGETMENLVRRADEALYRAKQDGRDCTRAG